MDNSLEAINALADKLGTTAENLWVILVAQANIVFIYSVIGVVFIVVGDIVTIYLHKAIMKEKDGWENPTTLAIVTIILSILSFVFTLIMVLELIPNMVTCIANPDYFAFKQILKVIK